MQRALELGLSNAVMAGVLALVALVVTRLVRRPAVGHLVWLLVLLKLVTPPVFPVKFAVPAAVDEKVAQAKALLAAKEEPGEPEPPVAEITPPASPSPAAPAGPGSSPRDAPEFVGPPWEPEPLPETSAPPVALARRACEPVPAPPQEMPVAAPVAAATGWSWRWPQWAAAAWLTGTACWFALAGVRIGRFHRLLRYGRPAPVRLQEEAVRLAGELGLGWCPKVWLVPGRISPLFWTLGGRAWLVVPEALLDGLSAAERAGLLAHELAHARRHDHWVRWLEFVAVGLYWWHPVAWWARHELHEAEEQCCDAWVVWLRPTAARAYAKALLLTVEFLDARSVLPAGASGIGHVRNLKRRLTMIVRQPWCPRLPWPVQLGVVLLGFFVLPLAPQRLAAQDPPDEPVVAGQEQSSDDDEQSENQGGRRDLEQRMRRLERRMDQLMRTLERRRGGSSSDADVPTPPAPPAGARPPRPPRPPMAKADKQDAKSHTKKDATEFRFHFDSDWSPEQAKNLERQIREAVRQAINPQRMKELERQIEQSVKQNVDPEKFKQMERQIEEAVNRAVDPKRMEEMSRKIEEAVRRSVEGSQHLREMHERAREQAEQVREQARERAERAREQAREQAERAREQAEEARERAREQAERAREQAREHAEQARRQAEEARRRAEEQAERSRAGQGDESGGRSRSTSRRGGADLERRMDQLEQKLNRLIEALDKSRRDK